MTLVRPENPDDKAVVGEINERAFGQSTEADLVDVLRTTAEPHISLVAEDEGRVIGHIFFSPVEIESGGSVSVMGLAPMAVIPERQRTGVGAALVHAGLRACRQLGVEAVVVLGHPEYYPRFGFRPAYEFGLTCEYDVPPEVFMAMELTEGALDDAGGTVKYSAAFDQVD